MAIYIIYCCTPYLLPGNHGIKKQYIYIIYIAIFPTRKTRKIFKCKRSNDVQPRAYSKTVTSVAILSLSSTFVAETWCETSRYLAICSVHVWFFCALPSGRRPMRINCDCFDDTSEDIIQTSSTIMQHRNTITPARVLTFCGSSLILFIVGQRSRLHGIHKDLGSPFCSH